MPKKLNIHTDGGARGNPGPAASAFIVYEGGKVVHADGQFLGSATNNIAEYQAVVLALAWLTQEGTDAREVEFLIDSELVVRQLTGIYKIKNSMLTQLAQQVQKLADDLGLAVSFRYIPRSKNKEADALVNKILDSRA